MSVISGIITIQFIRYISQPFTKWKAFEMGLIDETGQKIRDAETKAEKDEFVGWKNIIRKLKMLIEKLTGGRKIASIASFAAALYLLKEEAEKGGGNGDEIINMIIQEHFDNNELLIESDEKEFLEEGLYTAENEFVDGDTLFVIKEDMQPTTNIHYVQLYTLKDIVSDNTYTLSKNDLRKLK